MTGKEQAKLLGLLFWLLTGLQILLVGGIGLFYLVIFGAAFAGAPPGRGAPPPEIIIPFVIVVVGILLFFTILTCVPKVIAGYGLRKQKPWAKVWAIIGSALALMNFPFGTAVGVYGLVFILGDQGKAFFADLERQGRTAADPGMLAPPMNAWKDQEVGHEHDFNRSQ